MLPVGAAPSQTNEAAWKQAYDQAEGKISEQKFGDAEQLFRKALNFLPNDKSHEEVRSRIYLKLANTLTLNNQTADAQTYYQKLLLIEEHHHGSDSPHIVPALLALGSIQEAEGNHSAAMQYYRRALQINERHYGPYSPAVADNLHRIGRAGWSGGDRSSSDKHYKRSLSILLQQPGLSTSDDLLRVMSDYSDKLKGNDNSNQDLLSDFKKDILANQNQTQKSSATNLRPPISVTPVSAPHSVPTLSGTSSSQPALPSTPSAPLTFAEQDRVRLSAMRNQQAQMDPDITLRGYAAPMSNATLSPAYSTLNSSLNNQMRYSQSAGNIERSIAADIDALGPNHPTVANDLTNLAQVKIAEGKYAEARDLLKKALPIYEKVYGQNNALTVTALSSLAFVEGQTGNSELALSIYKKALAAGQQALGPNSLETARILNDMAHLYFAQGRLAESKTYYEWAVASTEAAVGDNDALLAACLKDYAQVLKTMGRAAEASSLESRADKIIAQAKP